MVEYSARTDWKINVMARDELVKKWVDVSKLRVSTTRGVIEIAGELVFVGKAAEDVELLSLINRLRAIDRSLKMIYGVRDVKWNLSNWKKTGSRWSPITKIEE